MTSTHESPSTFSSADREPPGALAQTRPASSRRIWLPLIAGGVVVAGVAAAAVLIPRLSGSNDAQVAGPAIFVVEAREFNFSPTSLRMAGPGNLTITLNNVGAIEHDFVIEGVDGRILTKAKEKKTGEFVLTKAGNYTFECSLPGHKDAGMKGTLTVGTAEAPPAVQNAPSGPAPVDIPPAVQNVSRLAPPKIAEPITRREPALVKYEIETKEVDAVLADGLTYKFWTFNGTVPGPMLRVRQGDTVEITLRNAADSQLTHSIDFHAVTGPGGGATVAQVPPGENAVFRWKALNPGVYVYHCATPMVAHHISNGMYGLIVVEPPEGLAPVDHEFYVMQGDMYLKGNRGQAGHHEFSVDEMLSETPDYVIYNGSVGGVTGDRAFHAKTGETIRIFFGDGGPNLTSSFHVIGEIFDRVYMEGGTNVQTNVQTTMVPTGGATIVEFKVDVPGTYTIVDHSLGRAEKGAVGQLIVEGPENHEVFEPIKIGSAGAYGGH